MRAACCTYQHALSLLSRTCSLGALNTLLSYESERQRHVVPVMAVLHGLYHLYGTTWTPVVLARSLGLQLTNAVRPVKVKTRLHSDKKMRF